MQNNNNHYKDERKSLVNRKHDCQVSRMAARTTAAAWFSTLNSLKYDIFHISIHSLAWCCCCSFFFVSFCFYAFQLVLSVDLVRCVFLMAVALIFHFRTSEIFCFASLFCRRCFFVIQNDFACVLCLFRDTKRTLRTQDMNSKRQSTSNKTCKSIHNANNFDGGFMICFFICIIIYAKCFIDRATADVKWHFRLCRKCEMFEKDMVCFHRSLKNVNNITYFAFLNDMSD